MRKIISAFVLSVASFGAYAQTTVPHTFTAGTAAKASEVNNNFAALAAAINNLADRLSILEGGDAAFTVPNMSGTYKFISYAGAPGHSSSTENGTLTLNPDLTFHLVITENQSSQITPINDTVDGTWSISGKTVTLTLGTRSWTYEIGAGNRILIGVGRSDTSPTLLVIDIFVRQ